MSSSTRSGAELSRPVAPRKETAGLRYPDVSWTSFDRYARYAALHEALRSNLGEGAHRVADVGDPSGWMTGFDPTIQTVNVDLGVDPTRIAGSTPVVGSGTQLPFRDASFDAVISSDALEHVPASARPTFLNELCRTSNDLVIVAAPFDTPGVAVVEEFAARFIFTVTGAAQEQLDEHAACGLPSLTDTEATLRSAGFEVQTAGNGNLEDWLLLMLLKHQVAARPEMGHLDLGLDLLYNGFAANRNQVGPFYRHVVVARKGGRQVVAPGAGAQQEPGQPHVVPALIAALGAELTRKDTQERLDRAQAAADRIERSVSTSALHLMDRFEGIEESLRALDHKVERLIRAVEVARHPLQALRSRYNRGANPS